MDERWVTAGDMAEALKKAKLGRKNRLSSFTRKQKHLNTLIDSGTDGKTLEKHYEELSQIYKELKNHTRIYVYFWKKTVRMPQTPTWIVLLNLLLKFTLRSARRLPLLTKKLLMQMLLQRETDSLREH